MLKNTIGKTQNLLKFIGLIISENETVITNLSMFVNKSFDLRIHLRYVCYVIPGMISCFVYDLS